MSVKKHNATTRSVRIPWEALSADEQKRYLAVSKLLHGHRYLIHALFEPESPRLRSPPDEILRKGGFSGGEQILLRTAMDFWNGSGDVTLTEMLERMTPQILMETLETIAFQKDVPLEIQIPF